MRGLLAALLLAGCTQTLGGEQGEYLQLQGFTLVEPDSGDLGGFLRWLYVTLDPSEADSPPVTCEIWEELTLQAVAVEGSCPGCDFQFEGTAAVEAETTCEVEWSQRAFALGFGSLQDAPQEVRDLGIDGLTHAVSLRWSPDLGATEGFQTYFAARPDPWNGGAEGSAAGEPLAGEHELHCAVYWELSE